MSYYRSFKDDLRFISLEDIYNSYEAPRPYILAHFEGRWEYWEHGKNGWTARHLPHIENVQGNGVVVLPTHFVHGLHRFFKRSSNPVTPKNIFRTEKKEKNDAYIRSR